MELTKINELMANRGYNKPIGAIFSNWEFVKDEILLPNRKAGSGNGTVHVYLLEDNMPLFQECFPEYIQAVKDKGPNADISCPRISHFVLTSNILTVAGFAYHHYNCDANMFNYSDFVGKVMRHDNNGLMTFESLFKLSTEDRPYFKQFDKQIFGKIIRYVFVPKKTAYKLYLFSDEEYRHFAVFWIIGQIADYSFIIEKADYGKTINIEVETPTAVNEPIATANENNRANYNDLERRFCNYMISKDKAERTVKSYVSNLKNLIPLAQNMLDGKEYPSPFTITNLSKLKELDKLLFGNPEIAAWNSKGHNRASAALHMYINMFEDDFTDQSSSNSSSDSTSSVSDVHRMDFTLTEDEELQMACYLDYLRNVKKMAEVTCNSYTNTLLKKLSNLLRDFYKSDFRNVYAISNYKELIKMDDEIWEIPQISEANERSKGKLSASFSAYINFVEGGLSDEELAKIVFEDTNDEGDSLIIEKVGKLQQFTTHLPLYTLSAACGKFDNAEDVEMEGWINVDKYGIRASRDMFVVHARGHSMEPRISDGDLCVFQWYQGGSRNGSIVLTQLASADAEYGGMYTIKKYYSEKTYNENGIIENSKIVLQSLNPEYANIEATEEDAIDMKTIGIFVDTIK